jgi:hypothetical protein
MYEVFLGNGQPDSAQVPVLKGRDSAAFSFISFSFLVVLSVLLSSLTAALDPDREESPFSFQLPSVAFRFPFFFWGSLTERIMASTP